MAFKNTIGKLWEYPKDVQTRVIQGALSKYGEMIGDHEFSTKTRIFTFDMGAQTSPRYVIAKALMTDSRDSNHLPQFKHILDEFLNVYRVCHHHRIQKYFHIEFIHGVPFLLSRKREMTLWDLIEAKPISAVDCLSISLQIVSALRYCEERGIVAHQDLKPENIFLDGTDHIRGGSGEVYPVRHLVFVADLELADAYRRAGVASGSRPYMAPEQHQALNSREPGLDFSKVDVFAIGVMLVEMLTGGYHPVGERRSLIWPTQSPGYQKWKRDMPWKQWINSGAPVAQNIPSLEPSLANLVRQCLAPFSTRINKANLELLLRRELASRDDYVFQTVNLLLMQADSDAVEGAEAGWPYYDELKARIEHFFASAQYNDH